MTYDVSSIILTYLINSNILYAIYELKINVKSHFTFNCQYTTHNTYLLWKAAFHNDDVSVLQNPPNTNVWIGRGSMLCDANRSISINTCHIFWYFEKCHYLCFLKCIYTYVLKPIIIYNCKYEYVKQWNMQV